MSYTLTVNFTLASPDPGAYRVKYWPTSSPSNITTVLVAGSPFTISGLTATDYTGTIEASCGNGNYSSVQNFNAYVSVPPPNYDLYLADKYDCTGCTVVNYSVPIAFPENSIISAGRYYMPGIGSGEEFLYVYKVTGTYSGNDPALICRQTPSALSCAVLCSV